jgi:uncharacterized membrane protein
MNNNMSRLQKKEGFYLVIVSGLYIIYNLYLITYYPVYIDEASTYNDFTSKGFFTSITKYPAPNNHVLFSIISTFFNYLPLEPLVKLRLPNLVIGLASSLVLYSLLKEKFNHKVAVLPHLLFSFSYTITFYSVFARGYMLIIFFTLVCYWSIERFREKEYNKKYLWIYSISSILGFYTIPIFLFVSASFGLYLLYLFYSQKNILKQLVLCHFFIAIITVVLYSPIIYYNGLDAIINNEFTKKLNFKEVFIYVINHGCDIYDKLIGIRSRYFIIAFMLSLLLLYKLSSDYKVRSILLFSILFFILPQFFMLFQKVIPGIRTWSYLIIPLILGIAVVLSYLLSKKSVSMNIIYAVGILVIITQVYIFKKSHLFAALQNDYDSSLLSQAILKNKYKQIYFESDSGCFEYVNFNYFVLSQHKNVHISYLPQTKLIERTLNNYDCIVLYTDNAKGLMKNKFHIVYEKGAIVVYGK